MSAEIEDLPITGTTVAGEHYLTVLDNLFTRKDCKRLINKAHSIQNDGTNKAWHRPGTGGKYLRVLMVDPEEADQLWHKVLPYLPKTITVDGITYKPLYLNSYIRFSRYREGGYFPVHCDGKNFDNSEKYGISTESAFTLNIFLNDAESEKDPLLKGGETDFFTLSEDRREMSLRYSVAPKAGRGALFWADQYHRGNVVDDGLKYLLRTDVMCTRIN